MTEEDFTEWKDNTRQDALEREVQRLRELTHKQSGKMGALRRVVYFVSFFFIVLFGILLAKGMLVFPSGDTNTVVAKQDTLVSNEPKGIDTTRVEEVNLYIPDTIPVPLKETKGIIYCVQIGAYTGIDLDEYKENLVSLQQDSYEGINQLTLGRFTNHDKAAEFLAIVKQIGFHDAFIMSFKNGRRVQVKAQESTVNQSKESFSSPADAPAINPSVADDSVGKNL